MENPQRVLSGLQSKLPLWSLPLIKMIRERQWRVYSERFSGLAGGCHANFNVCSREFTLLSATYRQIAPRLYRGGDLKALVLNLRWVWMFSLCLLEVLPGCFLGTDTSPNCSKRSECGLVVCFPVSLCSALASCPGCKLLLHWGSLERLQHPCKILLQHSRPILDLRQLLCGLCLDILCLGFGI